MAKQLLQEEVQGHTIRSRQTSSSAKTKAQKPAFRAAELFGQKSEAA